MSDPDFMYDEACKEIAELKEQLKAAQAVVNEMRALKTSLIGLGVDSRFFDRFRRLLEAHDKLTQPKQGEV